MSTDTQEIIDRALSLPPADKALVVDKLLSSLDQPDEAIDALWRKEVEDRIKAYNDGSLKSVSLEEVLAKYRSQIMEIRLLDVAIQSAVAASLCRRTPNSSNPHQTLHRLTKPAKSKEQRAKRTGRAYTFGSSIIPSILSVRKSSRSSLLINSVIISMQMHS